MQKITPFLWFDGRVAEAVAFYSAVFKNIEVANISYYPEGSAMPAGEILTATLTIEGQVIHILNGGPHFKLSPAISFMINCKNQEEVDYYWEKLTEGGKESMCGWLEDKFGLSWQVIPEALMQCIHHPDKSKAKRATEAMLKMKKIIIADLENA